MIVHSQIPLSSPTDWNAALEAIPHAFGHTWGHCRAMYESSHYPTFLYHLRTPEAYVVCPIAERRYGDYVDVVTPYGFSGFTGSSHCTDFPQRWKKFAHGQDYVCGYIGLHPIFDVHAYDPAEVFTHNHLYVLDLTLSEAELYERLSTNRKRQLRDWEIIRRNLRLNRPEDIAFFREHYHAFFQKKNAAAIYQFTTATLEALTSLHNVFVVGAQSNGRAVAASVFGYTACAGEYLFNVSVDEGKAFAVPLLWYGVHHLKQLGVPYLNLGGGAREGDGIAQFKERFGGQRMPFRCLKQIYRPDAYERLCRQAKAEAADRTGYFPAYRSPALS